MSYQPRLPKGARPPVAPSVSYDQDPLLYNLQRDAQIRELNREKAFEQRSLPGLDEAESNVLRKVQDEFNTGHVYKNSLSEEEQRAVDSLQGLGYLRVHPNGEIIPGWVVERLPESESEVEHYGTPVAP